MRNIILGVSILCLALSGLITFKALNQPEKKLYNSSSQPPIKTYEPSQSLKGTVLEPDKREDRAPNANQKIQKTISHLEQKLENNIADSQMNIQTLGNTVKQLEQKLADRIANSQTDTKSAEKTTTQLEQKLTDKIADSQKNIQTLEDTVKQLEQKLTDKIVSSQTNTQSSNNTIAQLEQKLANKLADSQINIRALENTVKQLEQKLTDKITNSQTDTQSAKSIISQPEQKPAPYENTSQNTLKISKPEKPLKSLGLVLFDVGFSLGKSVINDATTKLIQQSTQYILSLPPNYRVVVEGHTDNIPILKTSGKKLYKDNMGLSSFRAKEVTSIFKKEGISSKRISAIGYGATRPIASNNTIEGRAKNRRVVVRLIPEEKEH